MGGAVVFGGHHLLSRLRFSLIFDVYGSVPSQWPKVGDGDLLLAGCATIILPGRVIIILDDILDPKA
jgi:hypothetical protein